MAKAITERREINNSITISGKDIPTKRCYLKQTNLKYYPENPRIYSYVYIDDREPTQEEIEERLSDLDHVKQLAQSIKANGGLIDPVMVRDGDYVVVEGNSRLAAYRILAKRNPIEWGEIKSDLLPADIDDGLIFTLLGQYHIIGRKDWIPFEQAGYLWRRAEKCGALPDNMGRELGLSIPKVKSLIYIYTFMVNHKDVDPQHWSYYEEYFKSRPISRKREEFPEFDEIIVKKIKRGELSNALRDIRKVADICKVPGKSGAKIVKRFLYNKDSMEECHDRAVLAGVDNSFYRLLNRFRAKICEPDVKRELKCMPKDQKNKCRYELQKIHLRSSKLVNYLDSNGSTKSKKSKK